MSFLPVDLLSTCIVENGWLLRDAVCTSGSGWPKEQCIRWGSSFPMGKRQIWGEMKQHYVTYRDNASPASWPLPELLEDFCYQSNFFKMIYINVCLWQREASLRHSVRLSWFQCRECQTCNWRYSWNSSSLGRTKHSWSTTEIGRVLGIFGTAASAGHWLGITLIYIIPVICGTLWVFECFLVSTYPVILDSKVVVWRYEFA